MLIGKKYKIESDNLNIVLYKRRVTKATAKKPSHDYWYVEGYYSKISNALKALVDLGVAETGLKDLKTVVKKQEEIYRLIESLNHNERHSDK